MTRTTIRRAWRAIMSGALGLLAAASFAPPPADAASPNYPHLWSMDFARGIPHIYDKTIRAQAYEWVASHLDGVEVASSAYADELIKRNPTMRPWRYRLDLTACQHVSCSDKLALDSTVASLPESYYMHFSQTTTLAFHKIDGTLIKKVTIPGCPSGTTATKSCRVQLYMWTDYRWAWNPGDAGFQNWQAKTLVASLSSSTKGMFLDEHGQTLKDAWYWGRQTRLVSGGGIRELGGNPPNSTSSGIYMPNVVKWLAVLRAKAKASGKFVMVNVSSFATKYWGMEQAKAAGGMSTEFLHRPDAFDGASDQFDRYIAINKALAANGDVADLAGSLCYNGPSGYTAGSYSSAAARYRMWRLAAYYLVREKPGQPGRIYFNPGLCTRNWPTDPLGWTKEWLRGYETNVGVPEGDPYILKRGYYYINTKRCQFKVYARELSKGMVLVRTKDAWNCTTWGDASAQTVYLPKSMKRLKDDGTWAAASSSVKIRNGEAIVLGDL